MFGGKKLNLKIVMAVLIAAFMVVPFAASTDYVTAAVEDEETPGMAVGDAWGADYSADKDDLIELLLDGEEVPPEYQDMYDSVYEAIDKTNLDAALIIEVIRADESGYTISVDGGILIELSVGFDDEIEVGDEMYDLNADASLKAVVVFQGLVNLDADCNVTSVDVTIDAYIDAELTTNFSIMNYIELMNDETGEMEFGYVFTETDNTSELRAGLSVSYSMYSTGDSGLTTIEELDDVSYILTLDGKQSVVASVFANIDGEIAEALINSMPEDSDYSDFIIDEDTVQASMTMGDTEVTDMEFSLLAERDGDNGDGTFGYDFYLNDMHLGTMDLSPDDLPYYESIADIEVDPDFEYYLDSTEKGEVRGAFKDILSAYNRSASGLNFTVTYDVDGIETVQTVGFNKFVNPPAVPDKIDGESTMKCVGWMTEDGLEWNAGWGVKGDLTLYPVYAEEFTDVSELMAYMASGASDNPAYGHIRIDGADGLADFLSSGDFGFYGTLYVDVYDDDGKYLFSWTIFNDGTALDPDTVMDLNIVSEELTDEELEALSDHLLSGETSFMYIDFAASGLMPGKTTVTYNVGDKFADGTALQIYYVITDVDGNIIGLEPVRNATVVDGKVTFDLDHCSGYVLSAISVPDSADDNTMLYIGIAVAAIIIVVAAAVLLLRRKSGSA